MFSLQLTTKGLWGNTIKGTKCSISITTGKMATDTQMPLEMQKMVPLFMGKQSQNIAFVLDTSEQMRAVLESVKRLLIKTLLTKASLRDSFFNIFTFSNQVKCWSQHMLPCAPHTVYEALSWIHPLSCSSGRDLLTVLSRALLDPACHAVHLFTSGLPDHPEKVLQTLPLIVARQPVHCFYLSDSIGPPLDSRTQHFLHCLTLVTRGSCYVISIGLNGVLEKVIPLFVTESQTSVPTLTEVNYCQVPIQQYVSFTFLRWILGDSSCSDTTCVPPVQTLGEFFPGCQVLARKDLDGLYYMGTVVQEVQGRRGVWVVAFDHPGLLDYGVVSFKPVQQQLVCALDMVNRSRALSLGLEPGDAVLSPWEPDLRRYGPGRVMAGMECSHSLRGEGIACLHVLMWNGAVSRVPRDVAVLIPSAHHDRIVRELRTTQLALSSNITPICRPSSAPLQCYQSSASSCRCPVTQQWLPTTTTLRRGTCSPGWRFKMAELERKDDRLPEDNTYTARSEAEAPFSSWSDGELCEEPHTVKTGSKQARLPWRYWRRSAPEPQHRKPGNVMPKQTSQPEKFNFPVPQISALPNHSSLFKQLPDSW